MSRYVSIRVDGKSKPEHVQVWESAHHTKLPEGCVIHHINGNGKDNRIENLVMMTKSEHNSLHAQLRKRGIDVVDPLDPDVVQSREQTKRYYLAHLDEQRTRAREYQRQHVEEHKAYLAKYRKENAASIKVTSNAYREAHLEELKAARRARYYANKESEARHNKEYFKEHQQVITAQHAFRKAKKRGLTGDALEPYEIRIAGAKMKEFFDDKHE